jgi:HK97 family phage major capsid protein
MNTYTVVPFLVAFLVAVAAMPTNIVQICAWNVGTLALDPWQRRSADVCTAVRSAWAWLRGAFGDPRLLAAAALLLTLWLAPAHTSALVGLAGIVAEPTLTEVKSAIETQNRAFEEFKKTNDAKLAALEAGRGVDPTIEAKLAKIEKDLLDSTKVTDAFAALEAKFNKLQLAGVGGDEAKGERAELARFNTEIRSTTLAAGKPAPADLSVEEYRAYKKNFGIYLRRGDRAGDFDVKALSVGQDPDGGFTVQSDMTGRMVKRIFESSPIDQIAAVQNISTDKLEGLADIDELSGGGWVGEQGARAATTAPKFRDYAIPVHEQYENPGATQKLLDDSSINVENWLADKIADKMSRRRSTAFVTGNGVAKPRGFASYITAATADGARDWGQLEHVATGTSGGFGANSNGADKLVDLVHKLKAHFRTGARFVMSRATLGTTRQLKDAVGNYIWLPTMQAGQPSNLLGYPVTEAEDMAVIGASSLSIAFGNWLIGYQIVNRIGVRVLRDPYTNKPYVQFYTTARVGGDVIDFEAIKFLKFI